MKTKNIILILLLVVIAAQWAVPARIIYRKNNVLNKGKVFRFKTEPIDPSDPFRGRSVHLYFAERSYTIEGEQKWKENEKIYVLIKNGADGYAHITGVQKTEPSANVDYVKAETGYISFESDSTKINFDYPFEEYFMEESSAPKAEKIYTRSGMDTTLPAYAEIAVLKGDAAIKDLIVNGKPINELVK